MALINIGSETEQIEYKKSIGELKEAMFSIAAILNKHQKGQLYFGVKNDGTVIGQEINDESLRKVSQAIGNHIKPTIYPEIKIKEFGNRKTIFVSFEGHRCPYLAYNVPRIRVSDEDLVMDQDTYDEMIRKRDRIDDSWEKRVSRFKIEDVNQEAFSEYMRRAKEAGRIELEDSDMSVVLDKLELTSREYLLNAGVALFCDCGIMNEVQIAKFASNERLTFTDIRRYSGSIMELKKKTEQYLIDAMDWRVEFGNMTRKEIPEIPLDAIREAITNSFGHRMYDCGQSNEIAIFKNRIEIYNPGAFPANKTPESYITGNQRPVRRNPLIARTLYYSKDMESFATGLKRIKDTCDQAGCRVEFNSLDDGFVVIFYRRESISPNIRHQDSTQDNTQDNTQVTVEDRILQFCVIPRSKKEIAEQMGYKDAKSFSIRYMKPLIECGKLAMTNPEKPKSRNQKYIAIKRNV
ncbi:MAG: ATP-binding protein [Lachnospiraceae bacterium]